MVDGEGSKKTTKPYYRNVEDTLEDVGITQRQLGYWRKHGLFDPDLGAGAKYFTVDDTYRLQFLKHLIDDLGFPVATVKLLMDSVDSSSREFGLEWMYSFIDIENASLVSPTRALAQLMTHAAALNSTADLESWLKVIALEIFTRMGLESRSPGVYEARRKEVFNHLAVAERMSRAVNVETYIGLWPQIESDPALTEEQIDRLIEEREKLLRPVHEARYNRRHRS